MTKNDVYRLGAFAAAVLFASPVLAQGVSTAPSSVPAVSVDDDDDEKHWTVGLGVGIAPDYEGSDDYHGVPLWLVRYEDFYHKETYAQLFATKLSSNFLPDDNWRFGLSAEYVPERDDVDNNRVDDLKDASSSFLVGAILGYEDIIPDVGLFGAQIDARYDVANNNGYLVTPKVYYKAPVAPKLFLEAGLGITYANGDYMSNYFGIDADNAARSGLDEFDADSGFKDAELNLSVTYGFFGNWRGTVIGQYKRLLNDAKDSPITDDEGSANQFFGGLVISYNF